MDLFRKSLTDKVKKEEAKPSTPAKASGGDPFDLANEKEVSLTMNEMKRMLKDLKAEDAKADFDNCCGST